MSGYDPTMEVRTRPVSVIVLSIIGIIWASFAVLCVPMGLLMQNFGPSNAQQQAMNADMRADQVLYTTSMIGNGLMFGMGLVLLIGSIGSLMLKRFAWTTMLVYALLSIVTGLIWMYVSFSIILPRTSAIFQKHGIPGAKIMIYVGATLGALALIYQIMILVFYNTPKVKRAFGK